MKTVWKYELQIQDQQSVLLPAGAEVLTVAVQNGVPCLWATVDPSRGTKVAVVQMRGTGHPMDFEGDAEYVGTLFLHDGKLVFHVWVQQ